METTNQTRQRRLIPAARPRAARWPMPVMLIALAALTAGCAALTGPCPCATARAPAAEHRGATLLGPEPLTDAVMLATRQ
jgi:hypothetical protein